LLKEAHRCKACRQILNDKTERSVSAFSHTAEGLRLLSVDDRAHERWGTNNKIEKMCCDISNHLSWFR